MFDRLAAQRAAAEVLAAAPRIEGGQGNEIVFPLRQLVDEIVRAGQPESLVIPAYDPETGSTARYRLFMPTETDPGDTVEMRPFAGTIGITIRDAQGNARVTGFSTPEFVWHLCMALLSVAQESHRLAAEADAEVGA